MLGNLDLEDFILPDWFKLSKNIINQNYHYWRFPSISQANQIPVNVYSQKAQQFLRQVSLFVNGENAIDRNN